MPMASYCKHMRFSTWRLSLSLRVRQVRSVGEELILLTEATSQWWMGIERLRPQLPGPSGGRAARHSQRAQTHPAYSCTCAGFFPFAVPCPHSPASTSWNQLPIKPLTLKSLSQGLPRNSSFGTFPRSLGGCSQAAPCLPTASHGRSPREHPRKLNISLPTRFHENPSLTVLLLAFQSAFIIIWKGSSLSSVCSRIIWVLTCSLRGPHLDFVNQNL